MAQTASTVDRSGHTLFLPVFKTRFRRVLRERRGLDTPRCVPPVERGVGRVDLNLTILWSGKGVHGTKCHGEDPVGPGGVLGIDFPTTDRLNPGSLEDDRKTDHRQPANRHSPE